MPIFIVFDALPQFPLEAQESNSGRLQPALETLRCFFCVSITGSDPTNVPSLSNADSARRSPARAIHALRFVYRCGSNGQYSVEHFIPARERVRRLSGRLFQEVLYVERKVRRGWIGVTSKGSSLAPAIGGRSFASATVER